MANYEINAAHVLNKFLWRQLQIIVDMKPFNSLVPFFPGSEPPEAQAIKLPFVVYSFSTAPIYDMYFGYKDNISYVVSATKYSEALKIYNVLIDILKGEDDTASEINVYLRTAAQIMQDERKFDFKNISTLSSSAPESSDQEGGRFYAQVVCSAMYTIELNDNGLRL